MKYYVVYKDHIDLKNRISFYKYDSMESFKSEFPEFIFICLLDAYTDNVIVQPRHKEF